MNTFLNIKGNEWLLPRDQCLREILGILSVLGIGYDTNIFIPGIGKSLVGIDLYTTGYRKICVSDIEQEALDFQKDLSETRPDYRVQDARTQHGSDEKFGVIIDKSFLDVFIRARKDMKIMRDKLLSRLSLFGVFIGISMFHIPWRRCVFTRGTLTYLYYKSLQADVVKDEGKRATRRINEVAIIVASNNARIEKLLNAPFENFRRKDINSITPLTAEYCS